MKQRVGAGAGSRAYRATSFADRGPAGNSARLVVVVVAALVIPNALCRVAASIWVGAADPESYLALALLAAATWVLARTHRRDRQT